MKRQLFILSLLCLVCLAPASCAYKEPGNQSPAPDTLDSRQITGDSTKTPDSELLLENAYFREIKIDVDLTALSKTMVYAEVYNIMMDPESYVGKTIKGSGEYNAFYYDEFDRYFHYIIISDATGCCPQGLDFVWTGEHMYPDDYPEIGENIEVTGVFIKGEAGGQTYYYLAVDDI